MASASERSGFEYHLREFVRELEPAGHIEAMVVRDLARQAAAMEAWAEGSAALQRQQARRLPELVMPVGDDDEIEDICLAAAVSAPEVHLAEQHAETRSRGFYRALRALLELQARRKVGQRSGTPIGPETRFLTEAACEEYLRRRFEKGCYACRRCGGRRGHYLGSRKSWECADCKRQVGLRANTVAADSPLPLVAWFEAIRLLLFQPSMGTTELGTRLGIRRATTVRHMAQRISTAMAAGNAGQLLAGLPLYYARCRTAGPESGAREDKKTSNHSGAALDYSEANGKPDGAEP